LIPFNFSQPFVHRDVLIIYNVGLFGVMGLLLGVIPVRAGDLGQRHQRALRLGIVSVASLAALVSLYALSAILYRTIGGSLTMNRLVVIGWNTINIALLLILLATQLRAPRRSWVEALQSVVRLGTVMYIAWAVFLLLALPWLF
jgi:multisubunit Na+/H+ antiporter MnhF subunit